MNKIAWLGTMASIIGAFLMAFGIVLSGYICFSIGSVSWLIVGITRKDNSLITLNGTFFVANIIGLTRAVL
jgi:uncharacterized protein with PQ loop repeat